MNNRHFIPYIILFFSVVFSAVLSGCANEIDTAGCGKSRTLCITASACFGDGGTRSSLQATENEGVIAWRWSTDDVVKIYDESSGYIGEMAVTGIHEEGDASVAEFDGEITLASNVSVEDLKIRCYYIPSALAESVDSETTLSINLSQQTGMLDGEGNSCNNLTFLSTQEPLRVTAVSATECRIPDFTVTSGVTYGYFKLVSPSGAPLAGVNVDVEAAADVNRSLFSASINMRDGTYSYTDASTDKANLTTGNDGSFYLAMLSGSEVSSLKFTSANGTDKYEGTLSLSEGGFKLNPDKYLCKANGSPIAVSTDKLEEDESVSTVIMGLEWAPNNTKSWCDWSKESLDYSLVSYIPGVPLAEQGITLKHSTEAELQSNPDVFHFQWNRDFGFISDDLSIENNTTKVPNSANRPANLIPSEDPDKVQCPLEYYQFTDFKQTLKGSSLIPSTFIYTSDGTYDWNSGGLNTTSWGNRNEQYGYSAAPKGWHIPTTAEWIKLLPSQKYTSGGETFPLPTQGIEIEGNMLFPLYARQESGNTLVWSISQTGGIRALDIRNIEGTHALSDLTEEIMNKKISQVVLPTDGYREKYVVDRNIAGYYYCSNSSSQKAYVYIFSINDNQNKVSIKIDMTRKRIHGCSVRCIKDK